MSDFKINRDISRLYFIDIDVFGVDGDEAVLKVKSFLDPERDEALTYSLVDGIEYGSEDKTYGDDYPAIVRVCGPKPTVDRAYEKIMFAAI